MMFFSFFLISFFFLNSDRIIIYYKCITHFFFMGLIVSFRLLFDVVTGSVASVGLLVYHLSTHRPSLECRDNKRV